MKLGVHIILEISWLTEEMLTLWHDMFQAQFNPLAYTDVPETAGLARSINP